MTKIATPSTSGKAAKDPSKVTKPKAAAGQSNYKVRCMLTGEVAGTNPQVFDKRAERYGMTAADLRKVYVGRTGSDLLSGLVHSKGKSIDQAIKEIRENFGVKDTVKIPEQVTKVILETHTKVDPKAAKEAFAAKKAAALKNLLGEDAPQPKAAKAPKGAAEAAKA